MMVQEHSSAAALKLGTRVRVPVPLSVLLGGLGLASAALALPAQAQEGTVVGVVLDGGSLQPLAGAQVVAEGTERGTLTDVRGRFRFTGLSGAQVTLRVIMIGYRSATQTVQVGDRNVRFELAESAVELDQIVVTGTPGETRARSIGNAVAEVEVAQEIEARPATSIQDFLKAQVPGVTVRTGQGNLGTGGVIRIRGMSSLSLANQPLIYIDGVRVNNDPRAGPSIRGGSQSSRLNDISPENIASIEIIKGPAAATLYGTEASNGVIQIITKRGRRGEPTLSLTVKQGVNYFRDPDGRLPINYARDSATGELVSQDLYAEEVAAGRSPFQYGQIQSYALNVQGGSDAVRYYASLGYDDTEGIVSYNWQNQLNARGNLQLVPSDEVDVSLNLGLVSSETRYAQAASGWGVIDQFVWGAPTSRDTRLRGFLRATPEAVGEIESYSEVLRATGSLQVNYRPFEWLSSRLNVGTDITNEENSILFPRHPTGSEYFFGSSSLGEKSAERVAVRYNTVDYAATASVGLTPALTSATSVGAQFFSKEIEELQAEGLSFPSPVVTTIGGAAITFGGESFVENRTFGIFVQERLGWRDRIFLTAAVRGDDNSAFGKNFDFVVYPKLSATWVLNEEPFWNVPFMNALKLRAAWGQAGQQPDAFAAVQLYAPATGPGDISTLTPLTIGNPDLEPEVGEELEFGFDAGLFEDRLGVTFTYYDQKRKNAIIQTPTAPSSGFPGVQFVNVGKVRNQGIELAVNARLLDLPDLGWDLGVNFATNQSEVVDLGGYPALSAGVNQFHREDYPVGAYFMRRVVSAELDAEGNVVEAMCRGAPEDGGQPVLCAEASEVFVGVPNPTYTASINSTVSLFHNVMLNALVDVVGGHHMINGDVAGAHIVFRNSRAINTTEYPIVHAYDQLPGFTFYDPGYFDASFAKLRNLSLTYTLPSDLAARLGFSRAAVTVAGQNLAILWRAQDAIFGRPIIDPENRLTSSEHSGYVQTVLPHMSKVIMSMRLTF